MLLENLLRNQDGSSVTTGDIELLANWADSGHQSEIAFRPSRILLQDFTGVPAVVDLAAMRDAMQSIGGNPERINPLSPVDLVIDHSVMVDLPEVPMPRQKTLRWNLPVIRNAMNFCGGGHQPLTISVWCRLGLVFAIR